MATSVMSAAPSSLAQHALDTSKSEQRLQKKVAQLTKVIVFLNSQNETNSSAANRLVEQYEDEIQSILGHARNRVRKLESRVEDVDVDAIRKNIERKAQKKLEAEVVKIREDHEAKLADETNRLNAELAQRIVELNKIRETFSNTHKLMQDALEKSDARNQNLENNYRSKAKASADAHAADLEKAEIDFENRIKQFTIELDEKDADRIQTQEEWANRLHSSESARISAENTLQECRTQLLSTAETAEEAARKLQASNDKLEQSQRECDMIQGKIAGLESSNSALVTKVEGMNANVNELEAKLADSGAELASVEMDKASLEHSVRLLQAAQDELTSGRVRTQNQLQESLGEAEARIRKLESSRSEVEEEHKRILNVLRNELDAARSDSVEFKTKFETLQSTLFERDEIIKQKNVAVSEAELRILTLEKELDLVREEAKTAKNDHESKFAAILHDIQTTTLKHKVELDQLRYELTNTDGQVQTANNELQSLRAELQNVNSALEEEQGKTRAFTATIEVKDGQQELLIAKVQAGSARIAVLESDIQSLQSKLSSTSLALAELEEEKLRVEERLSDDQRVNESVIVKNDMLQKELCNTKEALKDISEQLETEGFAAADRAAEWDVIRNQQESTISHLRQKLEELSTSLEGSSQAQDEKELALASLRDTINKMQREAAVMKSDHDATIKDLDIVKNELNRGKDTCSTRVQELNAKLHELQESHAQDLKNARLETERLSERQLNSHLATHQEEVAKFQSEAELRVAELREIYEFEKTEAVEKARTLILEENSLKLKDLHKQFDKECEKQLSILMKESNTTINSLKQRITALERSTNETTEQLSKTRERESNLCSKIAENSVVIGKLRIELAASAEESKSVEKTHKIEINEYQNQIHELAATLGEEHNKRFSELEQKHEAEIATLRAELALIENKSKEKVAIFTEELRASEKRFENRPSRPADIEKIKALEAKLIEVSKKAGHLEKQNRQYYAEVQHQDEAMHALFKQNSRTTSAKMSPKADKKNSISKPRTAATKLRSGATASASSKVNPSVTLGINSGISAQPARRTPVRRYQGPRA